MKYWIDKESGGDNLIVISEKVIYYGSYSEIKLREFEQVLKGGEVPKALTGTPFAYIKIIEANSKSNKIKIYYGKESDLKIAVKNENTRCEIIEFLKEDSVNLPRYQKEQLSKFKASLKPLMFLMIASSILLYIGGLASDIESGMEYEVHGGRAGGQAMGYLAIGLAQTLGVKGVLYTAAIVLLFLLYKLIKNVQQPPVIESLDYKKKKITVANLGKYGKNSDTSE